MQTMIKVFIETAAGSCVKNRYDEKTLEYKGSLAVSRPYPYPYGFIIGTISADGDGLDCYLITNGRLLPGAIVECEPIGILEQFEGEEIDHKVLAAIPGQEAAISQELRKELQEFIYAIFALSPEVHVRVERILPREEALRLIHESRNE